MVTQVNAKHTSTYLADSDIWRYRDGTYGPDQKLAHSLVARAGGLVPADIAIKILEANTPVVEVEVDATETVEVVPVEETPVENLITLPTTPSGKKASPK